MRFFSPVIVKCIEHYPNIKYHCYYEQTVTLLVFCYSNYSVSTVLAIRFVNLPVTTQTQLTSHQQQLCKVIAQQILHLL